MIILWSTPKLNVLHTFSQITRSLKPWEVEEEDYGVDFLSDEEEEDLEAKGY